MKTLLQKTLLRLSLLDLVLASTPLVLLLAAACTGGAYPTTTQPAYAADGTQVIIAGFQFMPATLTVATGTTVTWTNKDSLTHTVTANDGSFDSSNLKPGQQFSYIFNTSGTYNYHCSIHPFMQASVVVQ